MEKKRVIQAKIFGGEYSIKTDVSPEYVLELARYVDGKMQEVAQKVALVSSLKIAVLAALNIADELFQLRNEKNKSDKIIGDKIPQLLEMIDTELRK